MSNPEYQLELLPEAYTDFTDIQNYTFSNFGEKLVKEIHSSISTFIPVGLSH